jgi:hypothetical protein
MALQLSAAVRNAMLDAIETAIGTSRGVENSHRRGPGVGGDGG